LFDSIASYGCHVVFDRSRLLSGISLVYGFHLVGGSEHLVFDFASSGLQDSRATRVSLDWGDRLVHVLLDLDFDSLHYLPERFGDLFLLGCWKGPRLGNHLSPAPDFHSSARSALHIKPEMDVRFVQTGCETLVGNWSKVDGRSKWIIGWDKLDYYSDRTMQREWINQDLKKTTKSLWLVLAVGGWGFHWDNRTLEFLKSTVLHAVNRT
jgi:hypothetical protein